MSADKLIWDVSAIKKLVQSHLQLRILPQDIEDLYSKRAEQNTVWVPKIWPHKYCDNDEAMSDGKVQGRR